LTQPLERPTGVTIIAILTIIGGIVLCFGGISALTLGAFFAAVPIGSMISEQQQQQLQPEIQNEAELEAITQFVGSVGLVIGAIVLTVGIGYSGFLWPTKRQRVGMDHYSSINHYINSNPIHFCHTNQYV
jgi:hypothetical protein